MTDTLERTAQSFTEKYVDADGFRVRYLVADFLARRGAFIVTQTSSLLHS